MLLKKDFYLNLKKVKPQRYGNTKNAGKSYEKFIAAVPLWFEVSNDKLWKI